MSVFAECLAGIPLPGRYELEGSVEYVPLEVNIANISEALFECTCKRREIEQTNPPD